MKNLKLWIKFFGRRRLFLVVCFVMIAQTVFAQENGYWDEWFSLPGVADGAVYAVAVSGNDLYVGGYFTAAGKGYPEKPGQLSPAASPAMWALLPLWMAAFMSLERLIRSVT